MAFCPKCGKKGIKGVFCSDCTTVDVNIDFKDIVVTHCVECGKFLVINSWKDFEDPNEAIINVAMARIRNPSGFEIDYESDFQPLHKPGLKQTVDVTVIVHTEKGDQEFVIPAEIENTYCNICRKKGSQYFEGVLQLRNASPELIDFMRTDIKKNENRAFIVKETIIKDSADFILNSNTYLRAVAKRINQRFNGELTEHAKLFSRDMHTSKDIYRMNVLFKQRSMKSGDIIDQKGRKVKIRSTGLNVSGIDIETGKKVFVK
jgi:NMD protein affecting ribosome stability and mRNA decay